MRRVLRWLDVRLLRLAECVNGGHLSYTTRARIVLAFAPLGILWFLLVTTVFSLWWALTRGARVWRDSVAEDWRFWYRDVYRVARYGSVFDDD